MLIDGPLKIGVLDQPEMPGRELHLTFTPEFQALDQQAQEAQFQAYLQTLQQQIHSLKDDDQNRAGMLIVQQIAEQLMPHLQGGDLELDETIVVEMGRDESSLSLMNLLG
ncbi:MAG: transcriptional regulator [gamma proteobacterium endosymbiont of Lamellibrachia anaximandri]|nr:transcriptional regulator [gamma proteobacterium endosymbiont of Lamellibrachia anaximandri]MBL3533799.1 transcriptional regulator [gamma proteobacterium endosymbiont of Lamellibrachia anaximandri]MBL3600842.1 transcriptional regulator [gamma proteobacterium endosymbiont of Lamellibrachia anaximandri]